MVITMPQILFMPVLMNSLRSTTIKPVKISIIITLGKESIPAVETDAKNITDTEISFYLINLHFLPNFYETWEK